jgi:hypothetical protein
MSLGPAPDGGRWPTAHGGGTATGAPPGSLSHSVPQAFAVVTLAALIGLLVANGLYLALAALLGLPLAFALVAAFRSSPAATLLVLWAFLLCQTTLVAALGEQSRAGNLMSMIENPILLVLGLVAIWTLVTDKPAGWSLVLIAGGGFLLSGLTADAVSGVGLEQSSVGAFLSLKFYLILAIALAVPWNLQLASTATRAVIGGAVIAAVAGILDFLSGGAFRDLFAVPSRERLGYIPGGGIFRNVAILGTFMAIGVTALLGSTQHRLLRLDAARLAIMAVAGALTLRLKAIVAIPVGIMALGVANPRARGRSALALAVGIVALFAAGGLITNVVHQQASRYSSSELPRDRLMTASKEIASDRVPLGVGFGQFGSLPSIWKREYSPVYDYYGLTGHYGFKPTDTLSFALDTSWPTILGESGIVGLSFYAGGLLLLLLMLLRRARVRTGLPAGLAGTAFAIMCVVLVDSAARATMFDSFILLTATLFIAPALRITNSD